MVLGGGLGAGEDQHSTEACGSLMCGGPGPASMAVSPLTASWGYEAESITLHQQLCVPATPTLPATS